MIRLKIDGRELGNMQFGRAVRRQFRSERLPPHTGRARIDILWVRRRPILDLPINLNHARFDVDRRRALPPDRIRKLPNPALCRIHPWIFRNELHLFRGIDGNVPWRGRQEVVVTDSSFPVLVAFEVHHLCAIGYLVFVVPRQPGGLLEVNRVCKKQRTT